VRDRQHPVTSEFPWRQRLWGDVFPQLPERWRSWIAVSTRIGLSHLPAESDFLIEPTSDFIGFASDETISKLDDLLAELTTKAKFKVKVAGKEFEIFLTLAHAQGKPEAQLAQLGPPFFNVSEEHVRGFEFGASRFRISNFNVEYQARGC
jgi:hypothetical protein